MIKRSESVNSSKANRKRKLRNKRNRRLLVEGLEQRQLLAGDIPFLTASQIPSFEGPRNVGSVAAFAFTETELTGATGSNDSFDTANFVPLGNGPGQRNTIDLTGTLSFGQIAPGGTGFRVDRDVFAFDLQAGDILDISTRGAAESFTVFYGSQHTDAEGRSYRPGQLWFAADGVEDPEDLVTTYPLTSPLQTEGNAVFAQVVPVTGRYYLEVSASNAQQAYTIGLRTYRPITESLPIGTNQVVYLDFEGGYFPLDRFNLEADGDGILPLGRVIVPSLRESLPEIGIEELNDRAYNQIVRSVIEQFEGIFSRAAALGNNGDYATTGSPGDYGITILNSHDHPDPGGNALVSRIVIGGTEADYGFSAVGLAVTSDIGNFDLNEYAIVQMDGIADLADVELDGSASLADAAARAIAVVAAQQAAHLFGLRLTDGTNFVGSLTDEGGEPQSDDYRMGVGSDGIFGTVDDILNPVFRTDRFSRNPDEQLIGTQRFPEALVHVLSTGTVGGSITGRVFNDINGDGIGTVDPGLANVTVFIDANGNGVLDSGETNTITSANGTFSLPSPRGNLQIRAISPGQFTATTPLIRQVNTSGSGSASNVNFGFKQVIADITGTVFSDNNGNGLLDPGDTGLGDIYIYLDLDGDNRPDLGEPNTRTRDDGTYSINFPGPGTYTIRQVVPPGFVQTFPALPLPTDGEHTVTYTGAPLSQNFNFGLLPSRDFGDAPDTYQTLEASDGPSHGITAGLTLGTVVDRELDGQPSIGADGDDQNSLNPVGGVVVDDEDGVTQIRALGRGEIQPAPQFNVFVTNTTGSTAFLQAFIDLDGSETFGDTVGGVSEHFVVDRAIAPGFVGNVPVSVVIPNDAELGTTYARFRLSHTPGLDHTGFAQTGEVEDYRYEILPSANVVNDDLDERVARNSTANRLFPLANDFETPDNRLTIVGLNTNGTQGTVRIATDDGGRSVFYTPRNGFVGRDVFGYIVQDAFGNQFSAAVVVEVTFQSNVPIAVDDTFEIPEGSVNRALNVLDNDVPSLSGGLSITSVTPGSAGGTVTVISGGQSLRYTPRPGFNGTEQFIYSVQDGAGSTSSAQVTINMLPGSRADDVVDFSIEFFDPLNDVPIQNLQLDPTNPSQNRFNVRVFVDDLGTINTGNPEGVASAFLDLLYTDALVKTVATGINPQFPFDITFGPLFSGGTFNQGNSQTPGLIDDVGGTQDVGNPTPHTGRVELFTVTFEALSPGVALFAADPADELQSETVLIGQDTPLAVNQLRLGRNEFVIFPGDGPFVSAIDDAFMAGVDSNGQVISQSSTTPAVLRVLDNDILGGASLQEFGIVTQPRHGTLEINNNGTPTINDNFFNYRPNVNAASDGFDSFTYVIVTNEGIRSTAEVTLAYDNADADDLVEINLGLVNAGGQPITASQISVGDRFGVQISLEDLRDDNTFVFAGFTDLLYNANFMRPADTNLTDAFDFDVTIGPNYNRSGAVGTAIRPGIIDEFGSFSIRSNATSAEYDSLNPDLLATIFFDAIAPTTNQPNQTILVSPSPADASPFQDTLLFRESDPVPVSQIRYNPIELRIGGSAAEAESPLQNTNLPQDVNNDGVVSPIDALLVINELARLAGSGAEGESILVSSYYVDVNGDRAVTASDALQVINYLTSRTAAQGQSELVSGEQIAVALPDSKFVDNSDDRAADTVFAELSSDEIASTFGEPSVQPVTVQSPTTAYAANATGSSSQDDDEEDVLSLLADDIAGVWA